MTSKEAMLGNSKFTQHMMQGSNGMPGYDKGGPVKKDGYLTDKKGKPYARVHKGERVVPAKSKKAAAAIIKSAKATEEELKAIFPMRARLEALKDDPRTRAEVVEDIKRNTEKAKSRFAKGTALSFGGMGAAIGSGLLSKPKTQAMVGLGGVGAMLAGMGMRHSARKKGVKVQTDRAALLSRIKQDIKEGKVKDASAVDFATGLRVASDALRETLLSKTAHYENGLLDAALLLKRGE